MPVDKDMLLGVLRPVVLGNGTWTVPYRRLCDCAVKLYVAFAFSQSHSHRRRMHLPQEIAVSHPILMSLMEPSGNCAGVTFVRASQKTILVTRPLHA